MRASRPGTHDLERLRETPSQTAGPYVHIGCVPNAAGLQGVFERDLGSSMVGEGARGERIALRGRILDGQGAPVRDALVEIWQADVAGRFAGREGADPAFSGFARAAVDAETGEYAFDTLRPGRVAWSDGRMQAPHITFWIVARGINIGLHTRAYFENDPANAEDPILTCIEPRKRVETLLARVQDDETWRFDIRLQGTDETVFFDM